MGNFKTRALGSRAKPGRIVSIDLDGEKLEVELRQPNKALYSEIALAAGLVVTHDGKVGKEPPLSKLIAHTIARCAYKPGTNELEFRPEDADEIANIGPEFNPLLDAAQDLISEGTKSLGNESRATPS